MNRPLLCAAVLASVTSAIHVFAGGDDIAAPLLASSLGEEPRLALYAVWHLVSVTLALSAGAYFFGALTRHVESSRSMVLFISILWICFGIVFLLVALTQPGEGLFFKIPQWILLLPVGLLGLWGGSVSHNRLLPGKEMQ